MVRMTVVLVMGVTAEEFETSTVVYKSFRGDSAMY